jgi:SAM-dependent methyltransferase
MPNGKLPNAHLDCKTILFYFCYMKKQQEIWLKEHTHQETLPTMANSEAASGVALFTDWLRSQQMELSGKAVDIGCGKGRNSVHLAECGFEVWALEFIEPALLAAQKLAASKQVADKIHFKLANIDNRWEVEDNFFAIAIDSFSSIDIETREGREICRDEMYRTLQPGGYALVTVVSCDDEWEKELIASNPGLEPNSTLWPQNGKFQKNYDEAEFKLFYKKFDLVAFKTIQKPAFKLGKEGTATNFWAVLRKRLST